MKSEGWCTGDGGEESVQPCKSQSSAESTAEDDARPRSRHRRMLRLDGRSSSDTSSGSAGGGTLGVDVGHSTAVQRGSSVDEAIRSAGHNRHVSFILSSGDICGGDSTVGHQSFDGVSFPNNNRFTCFFAGLLASLLNFMTVS